MTETPRTLTRDDLAKAIQTANGLSKIDALRLVESFLVTVRGALLAGEDVKMTNFGSLEIFEAKPRIGRNPKDGRTYPIPPLKTVKFRPSSRLKKRLEESVKSYSISVI